jgi:hypothetical protein
MQYVVSNLSEVLEILRDVQLKLDAAAGLGQRERFWSSIGALGITAGIICERMGLISFDMKRIFRWLVALLRTNKGEIASTPADGTSAIGSFINANIRSILVTKDSPDPNGLPTPPLVTPMNELLIRYESDTKCLYLTQKRFKEWCTKNQISYHETISSLRNMGVRVESIKKRMAKGLMVAAPPVNAILIDDTISRVFDVEAIVAKSNEVGTQEAGG